MTLDMIPWIQQKKHGPHKPSRKVRLQRSKKVSIEKKEIIRMKRQLWDRRCF